LSNYSNFIFNKENDIFDTFFTSKTYLNKFLLSPLIIIFYISAFYFLSHHTRICYHKSVCIYYKHLRSAKRKKSVFVACRYVNFSRSYSIFGASAPFMKERRAYACANVHVTRRDATLLKKRCEGTCNTSALKHDTLRWTHAR